MEKNYPKDYFTLVQDTERLRDKPLLTKQLSYFQDAMMRFTKNKYNVMASIILLIMVILSITVPMITPKALYTETNSTLATLPPRVPLVENIGWLDGTKLVENQPIDHSTVDPETGLGYPTTRFVYEYIDFSTLTNETKIGTDKTSQYLGGYNIIYIDANKTALAIQSPQDYIFNTGDTITIEVEDIPFMGEVEVYFLPVSVTDPQGWDEYVFLDSFTTTGNIVVDPMTVLSDGDNGKFVLRYVLPEAATDSSEHVSFKSITITDINTNDVSDDLFIEGYKLSVFDIRGFGEENGRFVRRDAVITLSSFVYDKYGALFSDREKIIGDGEYDQILIDNPGMEESIVQDPDDPRAFSFGEGFPIKKVLFVDTINIPGYGSTSSYHVLLDGNFALGFDDTPYFYFGTDVFGRDLFTLIWLGLRTSLLLGLMASVTNIFFGVIWGAVSAYYGGQTDILMERFTDIWGSFPQITMIGIITILMGPGFMALYVFLVYDGWIRVAKITRLQFYRYKGREYVLAARTLGASDRRIIFKHILPNALGTIVTRVILSIPAVIFLEVNLSFLGFGIGNGASFKIGPVELTGTSIGVILNDGQQQIFAGNLWLIIFPTIIVSILMITFNMFGNALRDALNPQLRGAE